MYFIVDGAPAKSVNIPSGGNKLIELNVKMTKKQSNLNDSIMVKTTREDGKENTINFVVIGNNDYSLQISSMLSKVEVLNGKSVELAFSIKK